MKWHPDVPDLPITKPKELEKIESMDAAERNAMRDVQVEETVGEIAHAVARDYHKQLGGNYEDCLDIVSVALTVTGSSLGGNLGNAMTSSNESAAKIACRTIFPEPLELDQ